MKIKSFLISMVTFFVIWVLLNSKLTPDVLLLGLVVAFIVALISCSKCDVFNDIRLSPKAMAYSITYIFVFLLELVKSNFDVALRVISPGLPINPGIVEVKTKLKSKLGRMILANSITLTPGTLTVEMQDERFFIHWIDVKSENIEEDTKLLVSKFEKYLEVIYG